MFWIWTTLKTLEGRLELSLSFTQRSISLFLKRHTVPILPDGISPF